MESLVAWMAWSIVLGAFYRLNQWLVTRKGLDHRPYYAPSLWGPIGTVIILLAEPAGWKPLRQLATASDPSQGGPPDGRPVAQLLTKRSQPDT